MSAPHPIDARPPWQEEQTVQKGRRQIAWFWFGLVVLLVGASPFGARLAAGLGACPFKSWTGLPCPGCGSTRAALELADFRVVEALTTYPLPAAGWILFLVGGVVSGIWAWSGRPLPGLPKRLPVGVRLSALGIILAYWIFAIRTGI